MWDPKKRDVSREPKLDNYFYKQLLSPSANNVVLKSELTGDANLKAIVEKFAQDPKAFHESFAKAFLKLTSLGQDSEEFQDIEVLLEDHPYKKFIKQYY